MSEPEAVEEPREGGRGGLWVGALVLAGLVVAGVLSSLGDEEPVELTVQERLLEDPRLARLIYPCPWGRPFDADVTDMTRVLVRKLERGELEVLQQAREELAALGEPAVPELTRLFDEVYPDHNKHGVVQNILEVCTQMEGPWGLELLRRGIQHPGENVRLAAAAGLGLHGTPEDYDRIAGWVSMTTSKESRATFVTRMNQLDPERMQRDLLEWLEQGRNSDLYPVLATECLDAEDPEIVARFQEAATFYDVTPAVRLYLIAPAARAGDPVALAEIEANRTSDHPGRAQLALDVLRRIGRWEQGIEPFRRDERPEVRMRAAEALSKVQGEDDRTTPILEEGLSDPDAEVRGYCLKLLVERGHAPATATALESLRGTMQERDAAMTALREGWDANPDAPRRAYDVLTGLYERSTDHSERVSLLQSLGHVPLREAAEYLWAASEGFDRPIRGMTPFRWCTGNIWNTGEVGRALLRERYPLETDLERRFALVEWIWQDHADASREVLLEAFLDPSTDPLERIYLADRLVHVGPASELAGPIKWAYRETTDARARPALECLLWRWYGLPGE